MLLDLELSSLGYGSHFSSALPAGLTPARVVSNLGALVQLAGARSTHAELAGRLRHELVDHERPTVGDWVAIADGARPDDRAIVHAVLPRRTVLIRRAAGTRGERQAVAANVDTFAVVTSGNRDASPRRLERYLSAIAESGAAAVVVLNKVDLCDAGERHATLTRLARAALDVPILATSATTGDGVEALRALIAPGRTLALVGMSGVGKSSLVNRLLGVELQPVLPIDADDRGRHTTTRRELLPMPGGGLLVDSPGMRIFGLADDDGGLSSTFSDVDELAASCRFRDCTHTAEPGCAVIDAIDPARLRAFHKLAREAAANARRHDARAAAAERAKWRTIAVAQRARYKHSPK